MSGQGKFRWGMVCAVVAFLSFLTAGIGAAADKITFAFDWLTYGKMAPFYVGKEKGYYKAENLEVKLVRGFASIDTAKRVGPKQVEFGMSTLTDTIEIRTRGSKVKTVWIYFHDTPGAVMFIKGKRVNKPKDLEGRTTGGPLATDSWVLFPLFAKAQGIDLSKVKHVNMRPADVYPALAGNVVESIHTWITVRPAVLRIFRQKGLGPKDLGVFHHGSGGVRLYSQDVGAHEDTIKNNPGLVRRVVRALTRSKVWSIENPEAALVAFWKAKPALKATSAQANRDELRVSMALFKDKLVGKHGQGFPVREKVLSTQEAFVGAKNLPKESMDNIYTDAFGIHMASAAVSRDVILEIAKGAALRHSVDPVLIQSMISVESSFQPLALSPKGAMGVMQLMPVTADEMGVADPFDVRENIDGGVRYFKKLLQRYRGNLRLALAAYNAGPTKIRKHRGIPPYRETRRYVRKVISRYWELKK